MVSRIPKATDVQCIENPEVWAELLTHCPGHSPLQAWYWGEAKVQRGATARRMCFSTNEGELLGLTQAYEVWAKGRKILWSPDGPAFASHVDPPGPVVEQLLLALRAWARSKSETWLIAPRLASRAHAELLARLHMPKLPVGFSVQNTRVIDLTLGDAAIRAGFHRKWRASLKIAERTGLNCTVCEGHEAIERFLPLYDELVRRKHFVPSYSTEFLMTLGECSGTSLIGVFCTQAEEDVAAAIILTSHYCALYFLGAASLAGRKTQASYLVQWRVIHLLIERGFELYDLGGIDESENPGVAEFKNRMGGQKRAFIGTYVVGGAPSSHMVKLAFQAKEWISSRGAKGRTSAVLPARLAATTNKRWPSCVCSM